MSLGFLAPLTVALALLSSISGRPSEPPGRPAMRIVDVRGAASLVARGAAVLDARDPGTFAQGHLPGAQQYTWQSTTGQGTARGRVRPDPTSLAQTFAALGVDRDRPALVYGSAGSGWAEEGHAVWLLLLLGHTDVAMLDGGFQAWRAAGRPVVTTTTVARGGRFDARPRNDLRATRDETARCKQVLDVRTAVEYAGATPYGESRGGHIANAKHLDWRSLLDESGRIRSSARITRALEDAGIEPGQEVITYCTAGVRSAFVTVVLGARGIGQVRNYDGSLLEWSADPSAVVTR